MVPVLGVFRARLPLVVLMLLVLPASDGALDGGANDDAESESPGPVETVRRSNAASSSDWVCDGAWRV